MSLTNLQLRTIHIAAKQAGMDDPRYRLMLQNVAGVASAKELDNVKFEDVMAVLEDSGFRDPYKSGTYWRDKVSNRGRFANERFVFKIVEMAEQTRYSLPGLCEQHSNGRTEFVEKLTPQEAWRLIEMLKAVIAREGSPRALSGSLFGE